MSRTKITEYLEKHRLTAHKLAQKMNISHMTLKAYLQGEPISSLTAYKMHKFFKEIPFEEFFPGEPSSYVRSRLKKIKEYRN